VRSFLLLLCTLFSATGPPADSLQRSSPGPEPIVGMLTRSYVDASRMNWSRSAPRPLRTAIWYPVDGTNKRETIFGGTTEMFLPVAVAPGEPVSGKSRAYPLVVMSHGTGGSALMMMWLGTHLAANGYIVAAVNHHGNTAAEAAPAPQGFLLYWERAADLKVLIDAVLSDPVFGERVDRERIGAAGFSLGGYTVIAAAGGRFSQPTFDEFCQSPQRDFTCEPQNEFPEAPARFAALRQTDPGVTESLRRSGQSYRDPRIKAVFAIAPALGSGFTPNGLRHVNVPVQIVAGEGDVIAPLATNARRYASLVPGARLTVLPGAVGHYVFLHECSLRGRDALPICRDAPGVDRAAVHRTVREQALQFFDSMLKDTQ
jgi:predicted dienelactone hydrolase